MATTAKKQAVVAAAAAVAVATKFDPIAARDRIKEINELTKPYEDEKASLLLKLEEEGFALLGEKRATVEDMTDPESWKRGDIVKCIDDCCSSYLTEGKEYTLTRGIDDDNEIGIRDDDGDVISRDAYQFVFVRRPE